MPPLRSFDDLITVNQAAELLGVHHRTVRTWIKDGKLPARRLGDWGIRIRKADVSAFVRPIATAAGNGRG